MQVVVSQKSGKVLCVHAATGSCHDFQLFKRRIYNPSATATKNDAHKRYCKKHQNFAGDHK